MNNSNAEFDILKATVRGEFLYQLECPGVNCGGFGDRNNGTFSERTDEELTLAGLMFETHTDVVSKRRAAGQ